MSQNLKGYSGTSAQRRGLHGLARLFEVERLIKAIEGHLDEKGEAEKKEYGHVLHGTFDVEYFLSIHNEFCAGQNPTQKDLKRVCGIIHTFMPDICKDACKEALEHRYDVFTYPDHCPVHEGKAKASDSSSSDKIKSFLVEDRQKYESLGCGVHNGVFYFGTRLFKDGKAYSAVVTSDKKLYLCLDNSDEIRYTFGLNYKDDFYEEGVDNVLSRIAVSKWLYEDTDDITLKTVFQKLILLLKKYIYLEDERKYSLLACYRIAGFFMPIWRARARLFIYAEAGAAKSRLTQILHNTDAAVSPEID